MSSPDAKSVEEGYLRVADDGRLQVPASLARTMGLTPGSRAKVRQSGDRLIVQRPAAQLARLYVEPTTACNLRCRTCIRHVWNEPVGRMDASTFQAVLQGITELPERPTVFFGGLGEPLGHPDFLDMVRAVKALDAPVEAITNGALLDTAKAEALIDLGLDALWVSMDGASPECYADVRTQGDFGRVMQNLETLRDLKIQKRARRPVLGIVFVAMRRNLHELTEVLKLEYRVGARQFLVTNVLPHTAELLAETLYSRSIGRTFSGRTTIRAARRDGEAGTAPVLEALLKGRHGVLEGLETLWPTDACPFVLRGSTCVRWDGCVSPCLPLLHGHTSYLGRRLRTQHAYTVGSLREHRLAELWASPDYAALRRRLEEFDFSPCTSCNSCELADDNQEDCFGNTAPTCGGCLWAQGFIRCP
ncbi:MAG: radical SAM protein [Candidatus Methylomirabilales bacterium]